MANKSSRQEKYFKHINGGRGWGKFPKIGLKFKNIPGSEKFMSFL